MFKKIYILPIMLVCATLMSGCTITIGDTSGTDSQQPTNQQVTSQQQTNSPQSSTDQQSPKNNTSTSQNIPSGYHQIGETVKIGNETVTIHSIEDYPGSSVIQPKNGNFLFVKASVTNNNTFPIGIGSETTSLVDANGIFTEKAHFNPNSESGRETHNSIGYLDPGKTQTAYFVFDTTKSSYYDLTYTYSLLDEKATATWRIYR